MLYRFLIIYFITTATISSQNNISEDVYDALTQCYEETSDQSLKLIFETLDDK